MAVRRRQLGHRVGPELHIRRPVQRRRFYPWYFYQFSPGYGGTGYYQLELSSNGTGTEFYEYPGYNTLYYAFGKAMPKGKAWVIPLTTSGGNPLPATPAPPSKSLVPDWYPGGKAPAHPLLTNPYEVASLSCRRLPILGRRHNQLGSNPHKLSAA
jgi:hypothetical protein